MDKIGENNVAEGLQGNNENKNPIDNEDNTSKTSDKNFIYFIIGFIVILAILFTLIFIFKNPELKTIDDLHALNLQGKLKPEQGYVYNGYSFVNFDNLWYSQVQARNTLWDIPFRYGPKELENIQIQGNINEIFLNATEIYMTFDPLGDELQYIALAIGEMDQSLVKAFGITPIAACDKNETAACGIRPIVTCKDKDKAVIYYKQNYSLSIIADDNCLIIQGYQFDIIKGVDRVLMRMYGVVN